MPQMDSDALGAFSGAAYGWKARIGLLEPGMMAENIPYEFYKMAPPGVGLVVTSLGLREVTPAGFEGALANFGGALERLIEGQVDAIVQAGLPPIAMRGWGFEDEMKKALAGLSPIPLATDIGSCIEAMHALDITKVAILHPTAFDDTIQTNIANYISNAGIEAVAMSRLEGTHRESAYLPLQVPYQGAKALFRGTDRANGVWLTGAFQPSIEIIAHLEADLGVPVISSMQALTWAGLRLVGVKPTSSRYGSLFRIHGANTAKH